MDRTLKSILDHLNKERGFTSPIKYLNIVIPAKAGIQEGTGCRIKSGLTELDYLIARLIFSLHFVFPGILEGAFSISRARRIPGRSSEIRGKVWAGVRIESGVRSGDMSTCFFLNFLLIWGKQTPGNLSASRILLSINPPSSPQDV